MRRQAVLKRINKPYLFEFFNVLPYHQTKISAVRGLARIINAFLEGINTRQRLPQYVVFILDKDFISISNYFGFGASRVMSTVFRWLVRQVNMIIKCRRIDLFNKKLGALSLNSTKIVWVKMIK